MSEYGTCSTGSDRACRVESGDVRKVMLPPFFAANLMFKTIRERNGLDNSINDVNCLDCPITDKAMMDYYQQVTGTRQCIVDGKFVSIALPPVADTITLRKNRDLVAGIGIRVPTRADMHVAHLDERMCKMLIRNTQVYASVTKLACMHAWDLKSVVSGDTVGFATSGALRDHGISESVIEKGVSVSFESLRGVDYGDRIMIVVPAQRLAYGTPAEVEISFGGMRLTSHGGYNYFGLSVPACYFSDIVFHVKSTSALFCRFQTGVIDKGYGSLIRHKSIRFHHPSVAFSHDLGGDIDPFLTPYGMPTYDVQWVGSTQTTLQMFGVQFFHVGHVTILLTVPANFNFLVPTRSGGSLSRFAILSHRYAPLVETSLLLSDVIAGKRPAAHQSWGRDFSLDDTFVSLGFKLDHNQRDLRIITYDKGVPVEYGFFESGVNDIPDTIVNASIAKYGTSGKLIGSTTL